MLVTVCSAAVLGCMKKDRNKYEELVVFYGNGKQGTTSK